ncbi:MAG: rod shape-determining protein MreC [Lachnospiraceae bacterium]
MRRKSKSKLPSKYLLMALTVVCILGMIVSLTANVSGGPLNAAAGYVIIPMQRGINSIGIWISDKADNLKQLGDVMQENKELQAQVDKLTTELNTIKLEQYDLKEYRKLLDLDEKYPSYKKKAANVIGKDAGNWFSTFLIDKGSKDGIEKDMNVIAGSGLVGLVTEVGPNYAKVRSIIDDTSNVSGMIVTTSDRCIVSGNLKQMNDDQEIPFSNLKDSKNKVKKGAEVVTSHISDKYLQGILIGYISDVQTDSNNLTKSGTLSPAVDFEHLGEVLVILEKKEYQSEKKAAK